MVHKMHSKQQMMMQQKTESVFFIAFFNKYLMNLIIANKKPATEAEPNDVVEARLNDSQTGDCGW